MEESEERPDTFTSATTLLIWSMTDSGPLTVTLSGSACTFPSTYPSRTVPVVVTVMGNVSLLFCSIFTCTFLGLAVAVSNS